MKRDIRFYKDYVSITDGGERSYYNRRENNFLFLHDALKITGGGETVYIRYEDISTVNGVTVTADMWGEIPDYFFVHTGYAFAHDTVTIGTSSTSLVTIPNDATYALVTIEGDIRYWLDGGNPTNELGMKRGDGDTIDLASRSDIENFRAISLTGGDVTIQIQYFI